MPVETTDLFAETVTGTALSVLIEGGPGRDLVLRIRHRDGPMLERVVLGLTVDGSPLGPGSTLLERSEREVVESYRMRTGKAVGHHEARQLEAEFALRDEASGREWGLMVRVAADGVAFRYRLPQATSPVELGRERTRIELPTGARVWPLEYQTYYETPRFGADAAELAEGAYGFPFLLRRPDGRYALISESAIDGRFSGAHVELVRDGAAAGLVVTTADETADAAGGTLLPWRVLIAGDGATVFSSSLVDDLAPSAAPGAADAEWIVPGRAAWSWWSDTDSPTSLAAQKRFVDYAGSRGWEHVLVDAGWDAAWVPELVSYAGRRNVGVFIWSHWEDLPVADAPALLARWKSWGVAGVKIDFMESEARERYRWYDAILAETARLGLMVNFHGSVIPRGWARTHPHVMSYEGIRGAEHYIMDMPSPTAAHNVIQPFTRNVVGSMDYTPVTFSAADRQTSDGHELALSVVFESGITHFADDVDEYARRPLADAFLRELAPAWHETRMLSGDPDREVVVARRSGDRWYLGGIATGPAREIEVDVSGLCDGPYDAWLVQDALPQPGLAERRLTAATEPVVTVRVADCGGFAGILEPVRQD